MSEEDETAAVEKADNAETLPAGTGEDAEQDAVEGKKTKQLPPDMFYEYEKLYSRPTVTAESDIQENLLNLSHCFGYDCRRRANLQLLDEQTLVFIAGNLLVLLDMISKEQRYLRSCSGQGIGAITTHPSRRYLAVAEKGFHPNIIIYEYPSLRPYRILRGGTKRVYNYLDFNGDGELLASVGGAPDYMLTLWDWRQEEVNLSCKAVSQEVFRVTFSPHDPGTLTSSGSGHIKFWKMASSFTGLKLQGLMGHFGKTTATDIEGYVELPDGKVVSGSDWGNLLLWEGNGIKVEICRKEGRSCHAGTALPFALEEGQLMTMGSDGVVRTWDLEGIDAADVQDSGGNKFEMEPMNELMIRHYVNLVSAVKSGLAESFIWFAQDSSGGIWNLDLSFTNTSADPECLFSFHSGPIQGMDISKKSHLMATTALDRSVRIFDFLAKTELTTSRFNQGGTTLRWAPPSVNPSGGLLVAGFEDGVVRLLQLHDLHKLNVVTGRSRKGEAELRLNQALKPHNAPVTAVAYEKNGQMFATGSSDCTVFFFTVGDKYEPIGFIQVPGPVQGLEWSPQAHTENTLLVLCDSGHVVEVQGLDPETQSPNKTYELPDVTTRIFKFWSIKSRLKREEEIARRQAIKDKKRERAEKLKESNTSEAPAVADDDDDDDEEELPPIHIPDPPSPLNCGLYSQTGQFWLSMGGYDSGYLYHCKFSENQDQDPDERQDEPFETLAVEDTDHNPIHCITFSTDRQLLFCGMKSGSIRAYPLQDGDLKSMKAYWSLSVHDNHYGHLRHIGCSYDDLFVLTAGDDGNIFSFSLLPPGRLQKTKAKVPSPRDELETEDVAQDIQDPTAYSIETAKQKTESDRLRREAEMMKAAKRKKLEDLRKKFKGLKDMNQRLPEHVHLLPQEFVLDPCFAEEAQRLKVRKVEEVRKELAWQEERWSVARNKLQDRFKDSLGVVTVTAIQSDHRISTYRPLAPPQPLHHVGVARTDSDDGDSVVAEPRKPRVDPEKDDIVKEDEVAWRPPVAARSTGIKLAERQVEKLRKAAEKAEQARAKIEKRKKEWAQFYAEKPDADFEDPGDVQAIVKATEDIRYDTMSKRQGGMNVQAKREELMNLERKVHEAQTDMNSRIVALRDSKLRLLARLRAQTRQLRRVRRRLASDLQSPAPLLPRMLPEEEPEKMLGYDRTTLQRYRELSGNRSLDLDQDQDQDQEGVPSLLEHLDKEMEGQKKTEEEEEESTSQSEEEESAVEDGVELSELEAGLRMENHMSLKYEEHRLLDQMETSVSLFDAELMLLLDHKLRLDLELKQADLHQLTLYQDLLVLQDFQKTEDDLNQRLSQRVREESSIKSKLGEYKDQLESKHKLMSKLQDKVKALASDFHTSLGQDNKFEEFLTQLFHKNVKRMKKKKTMAEEEEEDEDGSEEDSDEDDYSKVMDNGRSPADDPVCPPKCDPELFEYTLQLRERRLDLEDLLQEEKKNTEALKKDCETLLKKEESVTSSRKTVEDEMEVVNREKQQKMNEVTVVVPLRLHQIEHVVNGSMPDDLSEVLILDRKELTRLQERIKQLQVEKSQQRETLLQAWQQQMKLRRDQREKEATVQELQTQCNEMMMMKFGRLVDLEALQMLSGNRRVEELKQEKLLKEAEFAREITQWDLKVCEAQEVLDEVTKTTTEQMQTMISLLESNRDLEKKLNARQKKMGGQFDDHMRREDQEAIQRLQDLMESQSHQAEALRREIRILSRQGGYVQPPSRPPPPPLPPIPQHSHVPPPMEKPGLQGQSASS